MSGSPTTVLTFALTATTAASITKIGQLKLADLVDHLRAEGFPVLSAEFLPSYSLNYYQSLCASETSLYKIARETGSEVHQRVAAMQHQWRAHVQDHVV